MTRATWPGGNERKNTAGVRYLHLKYKNIQWTYLSQSETQIDGEKSHITWFIIALL